MVECIGFDLLTHFGDLSHPTSPPVGVKGVKKWFFKCETQTIFQNCVKASVNG